MRKGSVSATHNNGINDWKDERLQKFKDSFLSDYDIVCLQEMYPRSTFKFEKNQGASKDGKVLESGLRICPIYP